MAIKVTLLVVSALIAVAAAYPYNSQQANTAYLNCNDNAIHRTTIGQNKYELKGCTRNGRLCITGLPSQACSFAGQCYNYYWYAGTFQWSAVICQNPFSSGHCYQAGSLPNCNNIWVQEEGESDDSQEEVKICETDANGVEHCRSLNEGKFAEAMQDSDCFCVKDSEGHKACEPDNCDAGRPTPAPPALQ